MNITLRVTNQGNETASLARSSPPLLDFVVFDESGRAIYAYSWEVFVMILVGASLNPEESLKMDMVWDQKAMHVYPDYVQAEPGIYFILRQTTPFTTITVGDLEIEKIETPKIPIEIKP